MTKLRFFFLAILLASSGLSHGASLDPFGINANNIGLGNEIDYATVTISDGAVTGDIDFKIILNHDYFVAGSNFGIQSFYFNSLLNISSTNIVGGNPNWAFLDDFGTDPNDGFNVSEFGRFDLAYRGTGKSRMDATKLDPFEFTIRADGDSLSTYAQENEKGFAFAMHIADFMNFSNNPVASLNLNVTANTNVDSGWFSTTVNPVPLPAAFWLFGTALIGFIGFSRKTKV